MAPPQSNDNLQRTMSDIAFEMSRESMEGIQPPPISEVEEAKCECCGMSEECTPGYVDQIRGEYFGKWICGLCGEAVKEEMEKDGGKKMEEALSSHMGACARFSKLGRAYPVLFQAEAMREMLKRSTGRTKFFNPKVAQNNGGIARSSSCIAAITRDVTNFTSPN